MATNVKSSLIVLTISWAFVKNKYDYQTWNTKGIKEVKELMWLRNVKYLRLST